MLGARPPGFQKVRDEDGGGPDDDDAIGDAGRAGEGYPEGGGEWGQQGYQEEDPGLPVRVEGRRGPSQVMV